jgi:hypothetical protein
MGYEGIIQTIKGKERLILNVDFIRQAAMVEMASFQTTILQQ